ncbi:MAG TPA: cytochrome c-type biogenesis CcmF C-terminal domain-containing protein, partial [Sphingomicrobium sp.]|nr:cytochrome c-type biogenesis CcmF C-terminal domain-containing protein [Sphingomicrobium sp.]
LVRSGILTSVHSFAVDPERGTFLLILLGLYVGAALTVFAVRSPKLAEGPPFELVSREGALVGNNLLLSVILGIVFIGTLYPLFVEAIAGEKLSVGAPYFNTVAGPIALLLAALIGAGPLLNWRSDSGGRLKQLIVPALAGATVLAIMLLMFDGGLLEKVAMAVAAMLLLASVLPLVGRKLLRTPATTWGMVIAHFGVGVAIIGMAGSSLWTRETLVAARVGEVVTVGPWAVRFESVIPTAGPNWTAIQADLRVTRGSGITSLKPEARFYSDPPTETTESAIKTVASGQLYTVLGKAAEGGRWQLRLWWKPLVTLIWLGGFLIALGGALALIGRAVRGWRKERIA